MTAKPPYLPAIGTIIKVEQGPTVEIDTDGISDINNKYTYRRKVLYAGYYSYTGDQDGGSGTVTAPSPDLNFRYFYTIERLGDITKTWVSVPRSASGFYQWGNGFISDYHFDSKSPQDFGWRPPMSVDPYQEQPNGATKPKPPPSKNSSSGGSASAYPDVTQPTGPLLLNPPLHDNAKSLSPFLGGDTRNNKQGQQKGLILLSADQSSDSTALRTKNWGFRFLYNPNQFSYGGSMDINAQLPEARAASTTIDFSSGSMNYSFSLYLNRVVDLSPGARNAYNSRALSPPDWAELKDRGTELDIEYLWRTINGDPIYKMGKHMTANQGVLRNQRVRLVLSGTWSKEGWISSIQVNHAMFTPTMIPVQTEVAITFSQYLLATTPAAQ